MENIGSFDGTHTNTPEQKANYEVIKNCLEKYKKYPLNNEIKKIFEQNEEIFSEEPLIPELVIKKEIFNKNNCFFEANKEENNYFPIYVYNIKENTSKNSYINNDNNNSSKKEENKIKKIENNNIKKEENKIKKIENNNIINENTIIKGGKDTRSIICDSSSLWIMKIDGKEYTFPSSFDLFEYLTNNILSKNKNLDNYIIQNIDRQNYSRQYKGGFLYFKLMKYLPLYFKNNNVNANTSYNDMNYFNNNENAQIANENNYLIDNYFMNPNNFLNFGINNQ